MANTYSVSPGTVTVYHALSHYGCLDTILHKGAFTNEVQKIL